VISTRRAWFSHVWVWFWHFIHADFNFHTHYDFDSHKCDNDTYDCDFNTHKSDSNMQSVILTRMSVIMTLTIVIPIKITNKFRIVWFTHQTCDAGTLRVTLAPWVWFWHSVCDLNNHACYFHTQVYDSDTLRIKNYFIININLSCRHIPAAIWKTITSMRVIGSTTCMAL
jgi:hypothetical protein